MCRKDSIGSCLLLYSPNKFINSCADKIYRVADSFSVVVFVKHEAETYQGHNCVRQWCVVITCPCFFYIHKLCMNNLNGTKHKYVGALLQHRKLTCYKTDSIETQHTNKCLIKF